MEWIDPTNLDKPVQRRSRTDTPITEPAPSGFFLFRDTLPAMLAQWAAVIALGAAIGLLAGCGPNDVQAAQASADDLADAQVQAQVNFIEVQLNGPRPAHISERDWAAAQRAVRALRSPR